MPSFYLSGISVFCNAQCTVIMSSIAVVMVVMVQVVRGGGEGNGGKCDQNLLSIL